MADFLSRKLLQLPSVFNHRTSLPLHIPPHFTFSPPPPRRRSSPPRLSSHSNPPPISPPTGIVATTVCVDGSVLFRFGDPSEVVSDCSGSDLGEEESEADLIDISSANSGLVSKEIDEGKTVIGSTKSGSVSKVLGKEKSVLSSAKSGLVSKETEKEKIVISSTKVVGKEKIVSSSDKASSSTKGKNKEEIISSPPKSGSILKSVGKEKISVSSAKAGSDPKELSKEKIINSSSKSGSISKAVGKEKIVGSSAKSDSISKAVGKDKIVESTVKCSSSDDVVLESNGVGKKTGIVVGLTVLHADVNEREFETGSVGVEERETLTSTRESRTDFHEEGDGVCCGSDDAVLESKAVEMKTGNVVESSAMIVNADERETEKGPAGVEEKETSTSMPATGIDFHKESESSDDKCCSSDDAVLESNAIEMKTGNVAELSVLHTDANERETETGSVGAEEKGTSTSVLETRNDFQEESDGNQIDDSTNSPKFGMVVDIETSIPSEEDAHGEINDDDDDNLSPQVSLKLGLSNEECDSNEVTEIGENILNVDSLDSLVHVGGSVTDDYEVELMPKYARLEADLALEEEIDDDMTGVLLAAETFVNSVVDDDGARHAILADEITDSDIGSNEISDCGVVIEQTNVVSTGDEVSSPTLTLASGVASLPSPLQVLTGAEDAYFVADENWFIVANSVGHWSLEGMTPGLYAHKVIQNFQSVTVDNDSCKANVREVLKQSAATEQLPGLASVLIAHFDNEVLHVANIGDTGFIIIRSGVVHKSSTPVIHEFNLPVQIGSSDDPLEVAEEYQVHLDDGDIIIMGTDGLFDNLYEKDITSIVSKSLQDNMKPKELAELLATRAKEVGRSMPARCPFADEAQAAGYTGYTGGKLDHVTVIVSLVQKQLSPQE